MFRRLKRTRLKPQMRALVRENHLHKEDFIYPLFVVEGESIKNSIPSMPGEELLNLGIYHIILFGVPTHKDSCGSGALSDRNIVAQAIKAIKKHFNITYELTEYTVRRRFRGAEYAIHVRRTGQPSMTANGVPLENGLVPLASEGAVVNVEVTL